MLRTGYRLCLLTLILAATVALAGDDQEARKSTMLAVQAALAQGEEHLQRGQYAEAVAILEKRIGLIDGNRRYLAALRDAYQGHVKQLQEQGRFQELKVYR